MTPLLCRILGHRFAGWRAAIDAAGAPPLGILPVARCARCGVEL